LALARSAILGRDVTETELRIDLGEGRTVSARWTDAEGVGNGWTFVYAPGAGAGLDDGFGVHAATALSQRGVSTLRFQFPYREAGRPAPDRPPVLEATWRAAIETARPRSGRIVAGGRSMGGRFASVVAAQGVAVDALALFAYPLHPPNRPEQRRDAHLGAITVPTLFCSGDRDPYASVKELRELPDGMPAARLHLLAGADHGFNVLKSSGRKREDVWKEAVEALLTFAEARG
jgi:predicted alpha/beta-hydrolase family hydrolase